MKKWTNWVIVSVIAVSMLLGHRATAASTHPGSTHSDTARPAKTRQYMRIARIVIDSAQLKEYYIALREGIKAAVRKEPGVINLWAVAEKSHPTHITVFEIYADVDAYKEHTQTEHFKKYKATVQNMVRSLELVDVDPIVLESK